MSPAPESKVEAPHRPLTEFYERPAERQSYIGRLFDVSAAHYDWMSAALSFGTDRYYRRMALHRSGLRPGMKMLDVATGTGLVATAALDLKINPSDLIGLDPSRGMLLENQKKHGVALVQGKGENLPFLDETFDFISMGYALRHVESLPRFFSELRRVLKPGGTVLLLEISRPSSRVAMSLLGFYLNSILPPLIRMRTGRAEAGELMRYYWATIAECVAPREILDALGGAGFKSVEQRRFGPVLNDYFGKK